LDTAVIAPPLPEASKRTVRDWSKWLHRELEAYLVDHEQRMMIYEEDGWCHITKLPPDGVRIDARTVVATDGSHALYYEVSLTAICQCVQMRGTHADPGCLAFDVSLGLTNVDHSTPIEDWLVVAKVAPAPGIPFNLNQEYGRVGKMMNEYVRPRYLDHFKGLVSECLTRLQKRAAEAEAANAQPAEDDDMPVLES
jgi:hypothetical protein